MKLTASNGQTTVDICLQATGGLKKLVDLAIETGLSITQQVQAGESIETDIRPENQAILDYYNLNSIRPVSNNFAEPATIEGQEIIAITENQQQNRLVAAKRQSTADLCIEAIGAVDEIVTFCLENGIGITTDVIPGNKYQSPGVVTDQLIVDYYQSNRIKPITYALETSDSTLFASGLFEPGLFE